MKHITKFGVAAMAALTLTATAASAQVLQMTAVLSSGEETPALLSGASGTAEVGVDQSARELSIVLRVTNLPTTSTAGHIHVGPKGVAGPIVIDFPNIPGVSGISPWRFASTRRPCGRSRPLASPRWRT